ncbi:MAG: thioesterase [Tardiphaga sp.]|jgi:acyl-CoA thioester hydrolase|nr:thioesterase [Tardiphaga sp.]
MNTKPLDPAWDDSNVTYCGAIDAWECDQMQHMNIQFFARRISSAERYMLSGFGLSTSLSGLGHKVRAGTEHMIFKREVRAGAPVLIESVPLGFKSNDGLGIEHRLYNQQSGDIAATARVEYSLVNRDNSRVAWPSSVIEQIDATPPSDSPVGEPIASDDAGLKECGRYIVSESDCDAGEARRDLLVRLANHAGSHVGLEHGRQWDGRGGLLIGSATLDLKIVRVAPIVPEMALHVMSSLRLGGRKTVAVLHRIVEAASGKIVANVRTVNVFFDVASRKAVAVPAATLEHIHRPATA